MCLVLLVWRVHPEFPCVLAANRDEFHDRPTADADWWPGDAGILAGRDLKAGGTWLGVTRQGRFAALTNYRDARLPRTGVHSRGELVTELLQSGRSVADGLSYLREVAAGYNPFNILFSDGEDNSSAHDLIDAIEEAQLADSTIYTVRYTESKHGRLTARNKYGTLEMDRLANDTGGASFDASQTDVAASLRQVSEELRSMYDIGYITTNPARDGTFRKLAIRVKREGFTVRTKPGYYAR